MAARLLRDYGIAIVAAIACALLIRTYLVETYRIPNASMRPALLPGDTVLVAKWPFTIARQPPRRGDVIVYSHPDPGNPANEHPIDSVRRVVGLAGETVEVRKGYVFVNRAPLEEIPGPPAGACLTERALDGRSYPVCWDGPDCEEFGPQKVPEGSVFVIGDLRSQADSDPDAAPRRGNFAIVPRSEIRGRALWTWISLDWHAPRFFPGVRTDRMFRRIN